MLTFKPQTIASILQFFGMARVTRVLALKKDFYSVCSRVKGFVFPFYFLSLSPLSLARALSAKNSGAA
jgi:hypothetical protein